MIIVALSGGLGNQLFQYATAKSIALNLNCTLKIDNSWFKKIHIIEDFSHENATTIRDYSLKHFKIDSQIAGESLLNWIQRFRIYSKKSKLFKAIGNIFLKQFQYQYITSNEFSIEKIQSEKRVYLNGYWQNNTIIEENREQLLREFKLRDDINSENKTFLDQIKKTNAVAIHFRRGDYINKPNSKKLHVNLSDQYYDEAIEQMNSNIKNPYYYIFSDDINWVRNNIRLPENIKFIDSDSGEHEHLYLMSQCNHFIIANSTYSWWGAWLSTSQNKIVISPKYWYNDFNLNDKIIRIPEDWIKIDNLDI